MERDNETRKPLAPKVFCFHSKICQEFGKSLKGLLRSKDKIFKATFIETTVVGFINTDKWYF